MNIIYTAEQTSKTVPYSTTTLFFEYLLWGWGGWGGYLNFYISRTVFAIARFLSLARHIFICNGVFVGGLLQIQRDLIQPDTYTNIYLSNIDYYALIPIYVSDD